MFLVELVMQGVRGFRDLARLRFQSGFNFVAAGNEAGKTASVDTIQRLLYPSNLPERMAELISRHTPDASRGALVVFSDDNSYYRVIQDFSKSAVNLSKYNAASKEFGLLYKEWDSSVQFMRGITSGMSEEDYARLFILRREHYEGQAAPLVPAHSPSAQAPPQKPVAQGRSTAQEAKLAELRETLRKAENAADIDYKLQTAKLRLEESTNKMAALEQIDGRAADREANLDSLRGCETLPENFNELLDAHEQHQSRKMADSDALKQDIEDLKIQLDGIPAANFMTDKLFILGAVLGLGSIVAGLFVLTTEQAAYFPIGVLVSLALIAVAWYNSSRKNAQRRVAMKEVEKLEADLAELEKSFEQGGAEIAACMQATGSTTTAELREKADNYRYFTSLRNETGEERQRLLGELTREALEEEVRKQQDEVRELEQEMQAVAQHAVDAYSVRQEIERLESEKTPGALFDFGGMADELTTDFAAPPVRGARTRRGIFEECVLAGRIGGIETETLIPAVEAAAQRNLSAITSGKYVRVEVGQESEPIVHDKDHVRMSSSDLSHGAREVLYFCLRVGLIEALAGKIRMPFILDDPLSGFDPARQTAACQILRALGARTQVILFTSNPALKVAGDVAAELK